jgi:hypothetical protein
MKELLPWENTWSLWSARVIALDKGHRKGIRPLAMGTDIRRFMSRLALRLCGEDVATLCGETQLCAGLKHGCAAGIHAHRKAVTGAESQAQCMVNIDASNAFNTVRRSALLQNAGILWPRAARFLANGYQSARLLACHDSLTGGCT